MLILISKFKPKSNTTISKVIISRSFFFLRKKANGYKPNNHFMFSEYFYRVFESFITKRFPLQYSNQILEYLYWLSYYFQQKRYSQQTSSEELLARPILIMVFSKIFLYFHTYDLTTVLSDELFSIETISKICLIDALFAKNLALFVNSFTFLATTFICFCLGFALRFIRLRKANELFRQEFYKEAVGSANLMQKRAFSSVDKVNTASLVIAVCGFCLGAGPALEFAGQAFFGYGPVSELRDYNQGLITKEQRTNHWRKLNAYREFMNYNKEISTFGEVDRLSSDFYNRRIPISDEKKFQLGANAYNYVGCKEIKRPKLLTMVEAQKIFMATPIPVEYDAKKK